MESASTKVSKIESLSTKTVDLITNSHSRSSSITNHTNVSIHVNILYSQSRSNSFATRLLRMVPNQTHLLLAETCIVVNLNMAVGSSQLLRFREYKGVNLYELSIPLNKAFVEVLDKED